MSAVNVERAQPVGREHGQMPVNQYSRKHTPEAECVEQSSPGDKPWEEVQLVARESDGRLEVGGEEECEDDCLHAASDQLDCSVCSRGSCLFGVTRDDRQEEDTCAVVYQQV